MIAYLFYQEVNLSNLKEKFSWIRMMAKKSRSKPAYYLTYPSKFFD